MSRHNKLIIILLIPCPSSEMRQCHPKQTFTQPNQCISIQRDSVRRQFCLKSLMFS